MRYFILTLFLTCFLSAQHEYTLIKNDPKLIEEMSKMYSGYVLAPYSADSSQVVFEGIGRKVEDKNFIIKTKDDKGTVYPKPTILDSKKMDERIQKLKEFEYSTKSGTKQKANGKVEEAKKK